MMITATLINNIGYIYKLFQSDRSGINLYVYPSEPIKILNNIKVWYPPGINTIHIY